MKTYKFCPKCHRELQRITHPKYKNLTLYTFSCKYCYEDFYRFEVKRKNELKKE